ncbi:uncharacterized protein EV420DRAFT_1581567 [Desarmillaria tabescens]|uniref:Mid2 domain-containing protein n=1 Tax=Armillaria tabescens TaxID=1929756 RepID=A0AA39JER8_ARMTA|nr:uncharacterized protein EV420DRAFT_1581567 [Desarmillaria tabescens]KAK0440441.1 hypothetical protein EV420DRAFT_1581567 [Desarmillaria tabescens]
MLVQFIIFCFHFTISTGFRFVDVEENANVGIPFTLTWHRDPGDPLEFQFEQRNVSQPAGQGELIPFTPPDNGTTDGIVTVNFPAPGTYVVEIIVDNHSIRATSSPIFASNQDAQNNHSLTPSSTSSAPVIISTQSFNPSSEPISLNFARSSSSGVSTTESSSQISESGSTAGSASTTTNILTPSSDLSYTSDAASHITESGSIAGSPSITASTPASTSNNSSHKPRNTSTIIGAVIGPILFFILLSVGVVVYRRLRRNRNHRSSPRSIVAFRDQQIQPSSQDPEHGVMHKLRGPDAPVPASVEVGPEAPILSSIDSGMAELGTEDAESTDHLPGKGERRALAASPISVSQDDHSPAHLPLRGLAESDSRQIPDEEPISHASTSALRPRETKDEMAEEILSF